MFDYKITRESDGATILTASTTQLFVTKEGEFEITVPDFIREWRKENNL
jgi:acyl-CoA thioesterase FadM